MKKTCLITYDHLPFRVVGEIIYSRNTFRCNHKFLIRLRHIIADIKLYTVLTSHTDRLCDECAETIRCGIYAPSRNARRRNPRLPKIYRMITDVTEPTDRIHIESLIWADVKVDLLTAELAAGAGNKGQGRVGFYHVEFQ